MNIIITICILIVCLFVYLFIQQWYKRVIAKRKGNDGEQKVARLLSKLPKKKYRTLNNIMLRTPKGFTEIDHIVVCRYGVFVVETKNYNGFIVGSVGAYKWTQFIGRAENQMFNPIKQNEGHIVGLKKLLRNEKKIKYYSIIAFPRTTKLKIRGFKWRTYVVSWERIRRKIRWRLWRRLSTKDVERIYYTILKANVSSEENRKQHIRNIRSEH